MKKDKIFIALIIGLLCLNAKCSNKDQPTPPAPPTPSPATNDISAWITKGDRSALLQKQSNLSFTSVSNTNPTVEVDSTITYQTIDGFGYTLTGGSAYLINRLAAAQKILYCKSCLETVKIQMQLAIYASVLAHPI
jgi:glucosylceramidase